jgi:hypothetical protein
MGWIKSPRDGTCCDCHPAVCDPCEPATPCDFSEDDSTSFGEVIVQPDVLDSHAVFGADIPGGRYKVVYVEGAFGTDFSNPSPPPATITGWIANIANPDSWYVVNYSDGTSQIDCPTGTGDPQTSQANVESNMAGKETSQFTHKAGQVDIQTMVAVSSSTGYVAGSPNPTWELIRTKRFTLTIPDRVRVKDWSTIKALIVGCEACTVDTTSDEWDGTFPEFDPVLVFHDFAWNRNQTATYRIANLRLGDARVHHSSGSMPNDTGCGYILGIACDSGTIWAGMKLFGDQPAGIYRFDPGTPGWTPCGLKTDVRLATVEALPASHVSGSSLVSDDFGRLTVNGIPTVNGDRILVKNESAQARNGIYVVAAQGDAENYWQIDRASDYDAGSEMLRGTFAPVTAGSLAGTYWRQSTAGTITPGTTSLVFSQIPATLEVEFY